MEFFSPFIFLSFTQWMYLQNVHILMSSGLLSPYQQYSFSTIKESNSCFLDPRLIFTSTQMWKFFEMFLYSPFSMQSPSVNIAPQLPLTFDGCLSQGANYALYVFFLVKVQDYSQGHQIYIQYYSLDIKWNFDLFTRVHFVVLVTGPFQRRSLQLTVQAQKTPVGE